MLCNIIFFERGLTVDKLKQHGFEISADTSTFDDTFAGKRFSRIHIDTYSNKPYMLFARMVESSVRIALEDGRIVLRGRDGTILADVLFDSIREYAVKKCSRYYQYVVPIKDIWYKILVVL